jgi:hypothetical protein
LTLRPLKGSMRRVSPLTWTFFMRVLPAGSGPVYVPTV